MSHPRNAQHTFRLLTHLSRHPYICRTCRAQAIRQFHLSPSQSAERPFFSRIRESLFGSKESRERKRIEEVKEKKAVEEEAVKSKPRTAFVKGRKYAIAPVVDPAVNREYVPATTWDGLERMGSRDYVKKKADRGEEYVGFMPSKRVQLSDEQWARLLHHITVEILILQQAGREIDEICLPRSDREKDWQRSRNITISFGDGDVAPSLRFTNPNHEHLILQSIPQKRELEDVDVEQQKASNEASSSSKTVEEPPKPRRLNDLLSGRLTQYPEGSAPWLGMQLNDPNVKLTITKRTLQLTAHRLPDPTISNATTLLHLYNAYKTKPRPKKLAQSEQIQRLNVEVPNVVVHSRRQTPIDREKRVGRWKVIEDELVARDLPVTGTRWRDAKPAVTP